MASILKTLQNSWEKNWPEIQAGVSGGLPHFILASQPCHLRTSVPVFSYHIVNAKVFEADLDFLARNEYVTIDADNLFDHLVYRIIHRRAVVLTFDDGARNLYEIAFPLLQRYRMKAVAFIVPCTHFEEAERLPANANKDLLYPLSWTQIREMHTSGVIDFQSHTYEHRYVPRWPEPVDLEGSSPEVLCSQRGSGLALAEDFRLSKEVLEEKLNKTVRHLAFPKYNGTDEAIHIGQECGYKAFWWGVLPGRPDNRPGESPSHIVRLDGRYLRRLPGDKRESLSRIQYKRYLGSATRLWRNFRG